MNPNFIIQHETRRRKWTELESPKGQSRHSHLSAAVETVLSVLHNRAGKSSVNPRTYCIVDTSTGELYQFLRNASPILVRLPDGGVVYATDLITHRAA
jgi:hypothetical protein